MVGVVMNHESDKLGDSLCFCQFYPHSATFCPRQVLYLEVVVAVVNQNLVQREIENDSICQGCFVVEIGDLHHYSLG